MSYGALASRCKVFNLSSDKHLRTNAWWRATPR